MIRHLLKLIDCFFCHLKELKKIMLKKIVEDSFSQYYVPNVEIKDLNVLIDGKSFFALPVKNEEEAFEKIMEMSRNDDYILVIYWIFAYFKENYRFIAIDLSKQTKSKDPQQIKFIGKREDQNNRATVFFIIEI